MSNAADTAHDITVAAGTCRDSTNAYDLTLSSAMTKQIDAAWAAGTAAGGMATGTVANSTWYHIHLIRKDADASIDVLMDTSITAANKPAGYTYYRRIGSVLTDSSANILQFLQTGDRLQWMVPVTVTDASTSGSEAETTAIDVPLGLKILAHLNVNWNPASTSRWVYISDPDTPDYAPSATASPGATPGADAAGVTSGQVDVFTNTSSTIRYRTIEAGRPIYITTIGYTDRRGRDD